VTVKTKNLGQVQPLYINLNPPKNITMLWYNQNDNNIYYYDTVADQWTLLKGGSGPSSNNGLVLLTKSTIILAPVLRLTYSGKTGGNIISGDTIIDVHGSTGVVTSCTNGSSGSIIFTSVNIVAGQTTFVGPVTDGPVTFTPVLLTWNDATINLTMSGSQSNYIVKDVLLTNAVNSNGDVRDFQLWDAIGRTGNQFFKTNSGMSDSLSTILSNNESYISSQDGDIVVCQTPKIWAPQTLYATFGTPDSRGAFAKVDVIIKGYLEQ
jgi:hypothetical protein